MPINSTNNDSTLYFARCLGIYHLLARPTGETFTTYTLVVTILSIFSILSAFGNGLIIYVYLKQKSLQRTNTLLLTCLAFLDFVSAVLLEPLYVVRLLSEIFGFTSCVFILIVRRLFEYLRPASFMTLALITIERYLALFKAITHRRMMTKQRILHVVLLIWFLWFLVICIRSFFPEIAPTFYIFFTFVAFSLLMSNLVMYFKIGKLARLHSRPTRVSHAPGSLSVRYENPRSLSWGSTNPGVTCSQTKAPNAKNILNGRRRSSKKIGVQLLESVVKTTRIDVHPHEKASTESDVLSTVGETSTNLGSDVDTNHLRNNFKASNPHALDNTATIYAGSKNEAKINNCETDVENNTSEAAKVKGRDITRAFENKENGKNFARISSTHVNTLPINNTSVCGLECSDDSTGYMETNEVSNGNSPRQFQSTDSTKENASKTSQFTNKEKLETKTDFNDSTILESNSKSLLQAQDTPDSTENTINSNSVKSFENTRQVKDKIEVENDTTVKNRIVEATQLDEAMTQVKTSPQKLNTEPDGSSTNFILKSTEKTSKTARQTTSRASIKNVKLETKERNATWTVFYIVAILTLCYLPISVLLVYLSFQKEPDATTLFIYLPIADTVALFNALVNPFIYCLKNRKMRVAVKSVLQRTRNST